MTENKRADFSEFELELIKARKKKKVKEVKIKVVKEEKKEETLEDAIEEATKEVFEKKEEETSLSELFIEEEKKEKKETGEVSDKDYQKINLTEVVEDADVTPTTTGDIYGANSGGGLEGGYAGIGNTGYAGIGNSPYGTAGSAYGAAGGAYGAAGDAYGSAYGPNGEGGDVYNVGEENKAGSAAVSSGGLQEKLKQKDEMRGTRITPALEAHQAHQGGPPDPSCTYCKKAF